MTSSQISLNLYLRHKSNNKAEKEMKLNFHENFQFTTVQIKRRSSTLKVPNLLASAQMVRRK